MNKLTTQPIQSSELIVNDDGSIYHINLREEDIAPIVLLVGDQGRVARISSHFDEIESRHHKREFVTHTGRYKGQRITAISTGIGTDNIDIVINELDAAINIDLHTRIRKPKRRSLKLIRIGTSGALHADISVGSFVMAEYGLGFDGLMHYYNYSKTKSEQALEDKVNQHLQWDPNLSKPYLIEGSPLLRRLLGDGMTKGITATATGFYGPQGRSLYYASKEHNIHDKLGSFNHDSHRITNFEMETSALYGLAKMMDHEACTCCVILANRMTKQYSDNYKADVDRLIKIVLDQLTKE